MSIVVAAATSIDAAIVVVYLIAAFGIGIVASRCFSRDRQHAKVNPSTPTDDSVSTDSSPHEEEDYYLAGRRVPGWMNGISYAVTAMNADVAPTYCGFAVVVGLPIAFFYLPRFALAWMIAATLFAVRWRQLGVRTGPEFYALRFSVKRARFVRIYSSLFAVVVNMVPWIGAGMLGVHKIFGPLFDVDVLAADLGVEPKVVTLSIILPILLIYVWISGFAGVLITDVLQSVIIVGANIVLLGYVMADFGGPAGLAAAVEMARPVDSPEILSTWPVWGHRVLAPMVVLAWLVVPTVGRGGSVLFDSKERPQRAQDSRPHEESKAEDQQCARVDIFIGYQHPHDRKVERDRDAGPAELGNGGMSCGGHHVRSRGRRIRNRDGASPW